MMSSSGVKVHHHSFCCLGLLTVRLVRGRKSAMITNKQYFTGLWVSKTKGKGESLGVKLYLG